MEEEKRSRTKESRPLRHILSNLDVVLWTQGFKERMSRRGLYLILLEEVFSLEKGPRSGFGLLYKMPNLTGAFFVSFLSLDFSLLLVTHTQSPTPCVWLREDVQGKERDPPGKGKRHPAVGRRDVRRMDSWYVFPSHPSDVSPKTATARFWSNRRGSFSRKTSSFPPGGQSCIREVSRIRPRSGSSVYNHSHLVFYWMVSKRRHQSVDRPSAKALGLSPLSSVFY